MKPTGNWGIRELGNQDLPPRQGSLDLRDTGYRCLASAGC